MFPFLNHPNIYKEWKSSSSQIDLPVGETIIDIGAYIHAIPFVKTGAVKVVRQDDTGNELYLYHIMEGQSCAMTLISFFAGKRSEVLAQTVEQSRLITVPADDFRIWMNRFPQVYEFVQQTYHQRFIELLEALDSVAFNRIDTQLIRLLKERSQALGSTSITATHKAIAQELNTSREVVSRLLKKLEKNGAVDLGRNSITVKNLPGDS